MTREAHLVITDSGFGGLSLMARLEQTLQGRQVRLSYVNACPSDQLGYNQLPTLDHKRRTFANVLRAIEARLAPDAVFVACNTLSTLLPAPALPLTTREDASSVAPGDDAGARDSPPCEVHDILGAGVALLAAALERDHTRPILALSTATTANARAWSAGLAARGLDDGRIIYHPCPGLETAISNDPDGLRVPLLLERLAAAQGQPPPHAVLLGCTHYSHRADWFRRAFAPLAPDLELLDPVAHMAEALTARWAPRLPPGALRGDFLGRYEPPTREVDTYLRLLTSSPVTAAALAHRQTVQDLFEIASS